MPSAYHEAYGRWLDTYLRTGDRKPVGAGRLVNGQRKDGSVFPISIAVSESSVDGRRIFTGIIHDLSEIKRAEDERDRLLMLSPDMLCIAGADGHFKHINGAWSRTLGWTDIQMLETPWMDFVHPDDRELTLWACAELFKGQTIRGFENRYRRVDGTYRWFSWSGIPYPEEKTAFCAARDVTDQKLAQEAMHRIERTNKLQAIKLDHASRLTLAGQMAAALAHEVNQPLGAAANFLHAAALKFSDPPLADETPLGLLREAAASVGRAGKIVQQMLGFAGQRPRQREPVDINDVLRDSAVLMRPLAAMHRIEIRLEECEPAVVDVDRLGIQQVVCNLVANSIHAIDQEGARADRIIAISARATGPQGRGVTVRITDTGPGIPEELLARLFEPFQTGRPDGLGLGLWISRSLIEADRGEIHAVVSDGLGAVFEFGLPAVVPAKPEGSRMTVDA
ncbi:MAG: PAS domain S-box protein [Planctomycetota bacterium]|nr:PAS domain S-box protein [Planctomycetota bacterium]